MFPLKDLNPNLRFPIITLLLIFSNIFIYFFFQLRPGINSYIIHEFALYPIEIKNFLVSFKLPQKNFIPDLFTYMFLHGGPAHVLLNCWFLWIFGNNVEGVMGPIRYLLFYLSCGIFACLVHVAITPSPNMPIVGASGAIAGVMGAYLILFPGAMILTFLPIPFLWILPIPAFIFLIIWFGLQLLNGLTGLLNSGSDLSNIAFWAHIGGFVGGIYGGVVNRKRKLRVYKKKYYDGDFKKR